MNMNENCVIVGFGAGNGLAIAKAFAREGCELALIARSRAKQEKALGELEAAGVSAKFFEADAADESALRAAFAQIRSEVGQPAVLIYNAFAMRMGPASKLRPDDLMSDLRTNVGGALACVHVVLPAMRAAKRGTIIFTGGGFALEPYPQFASIGIGKAAIRNLALVLAKELTPEGIHVATVTIEGMVKPGTAFAPEKIAELFVRLYRQPASSFDAELRYTGENS